MIGKAVALVALLILSILNALGNFYFTYGIWPKSWTSFVFFGLTGLVLYGLLTAVAKEE